jgi:hypothetical protein
VLSFFFFFPPPLSFDSIAAQMAPRLVELATDPWWEVRAQVGLCSAYILEHLPADSEHAGEIIEAAARVLVPPGTASGGLGGGDGGGDGDGPLHAVRAAPNVRVARVALSYLARCLATHPGLAAPYLECLLLLPATDRARLLAAGAGDLGEPTLGVLGRLVGNYRTVRLPAEWDGAAIMAAVGRQARQSGLGNLEPAHVEILAACAAGIDLADPAQHEAVSGWGYGNFFFIYFIF